MYRRDSEWPITIGLDKKNIYFYNRKIDKAQLLNYVLPIYKSEIDSLRRMYK